MCRTPLSRLSASRTSMVSSPGTEKTNRQPSAARHSTNRSAAVRGAGSCSGGMLRVYGGLGGAEGFAMIGLPQPGIFALGTSAHEFLEFDLRPDIGMVSVVEVFGH